MWLPFLQFLALTALLPRAVTATLHLGVSLDMNEKFKHLKSYSSIALLGEVPGTTEDISDYQLVWLAKKAFEEMIDSYLSQPNIDPTMAPGAMVVLAPPNSKKILFGSSIRLYVGKEIYTQAPVKKYLSQCNHRTEARCGEFNVVELFYEEYPHCNPSGSRIAAWVRPRDNNDNLRVGKLVPPCSSDKGVPGCQEFIKDFSLIAIKDKAPQEPPASWEFPLSCNSRNFAQLSSYSPSPPGSQGGGSGS